MDCYEVSLLVPAALVETPPVEDEEWVWTPWQIVPASNREEAWWRAINRFKRDHHEVASRRSRVRNVVPVPKMEQR